PGQPADLAAAGGRGPALGVGGVRLLLPELRGLLPGLPAVEGRAADADLRGLHSLDVLLDLHLLVRALLRHPLRGGTEGEEPAARLRPGAGDGRAEPDAALPD